MSEEQQRQLEASAAALWEAQRQTGLSALSSCTPEELRRAIRTALEQPTPALGMAALVGAITGFALRRADRRNTP